MINIGNIIKLYYNIKIIKSNKFVGKIENYNDLRVSYSIIRIKKKWLIY